MKKTVLNIIFSLVVLSVNAQTIKVRYFKNNRLNREVPKIMSKFSETIIQNTDSSTTTTVKKMKTGEILYSCTYKGYEPCGKWIYRRFDSIEELDYSFKVKYDTNDCADSSSGIDAYTLKKSAEKLADRKIIGYESIFEFTTNNKVNFSVLPDNISLGKVYVSFILTEKKQAEDIVIIKGANIALDKEAVRLIRKLEFPLLSSENKQLKKSCVVVLINFDSLIRS